jgi:regulation of enolase protein 1 (concanavalin A-like superfamily)
MRWLNEPARWFGDLDGLTVAAEAGTDFWRTTHYGYVRDSGHFAYEELGSEIALRFRGEWAAQYDQAGLMLRVDDENWIKAGIERADGREWLSVVVTRGLSDWSQQPAAPDADGWWTVRASGIAIRCSCCAATTDPLAPLSGVKAGPMCGAQGPGLLPVRARIAAGELRQGRVQIASRPQGSTLVR